jgi:hypothetical protein
MSDRPSSPDGYAAAVEALSAYRDQCERAGWPASFFECTCALTVLAEAREFDLQGMQVGLSMPLDLGPSGG